MNPKSAHDRLNDVNHYAAMHTSIDLKNALAWQTRLQAMITRHPLRTLLQPLLLVLPAGGFASLVLWAASAQEFSFTSAVMIGLAGLVGIVVIVNVGSVIGEIRSAPTEIIRATARVEEVRATIAKLYAEADELQIEVDRIDLLAANRPEDDEAKDQLFAWLQEQYPGSTFDEAMEFLTADMGQVSKPSHGSHPNR